MRLWLFVLLVLMLPHALASPNEASGIVAHVADGDSFTVEGVGDIRLADVNSPELDAPGGPEAKEYTWSNLLDKRVFLDIDNKTVKDKYGRYVCIVYLASADGSVGANFNHMLVDSGHAIVEDSKDNEFNPADWWAVSAEKPEGDVKKFVGSAKSNKYHYPNCQWARKISPQNEVWFTSSEDARSKGYVPCGVCHPP